MRKRKHDEYVANGQRFFFLYDNQQPNVLHVIHRGTSPEAAIRAYFEAEPTWNEARKRYESIGTTHGIYWAHLPDQDVVLVISCFALGGE